MTEPGRGRRAQCGYFENKANEVAAEGYAVGTADCLGKWECQFKDFHDAEQFCTTQADCTTIIQHDPVTQGDDCADGLGCFTPRKGALEPTEDVGLKSYIYQCST